MLTSLRIAECFIIYRINTVFDICAGQKAGLMIHIINLTDAVIGRHPRCRRLSRPCRNRTDPDFAPVST